MEDYDAAQIMNSQEIKEFINENRCLFWWIKESEVENISIDLLVETLLNYGNEKNIKKLFDLIGIDRVAEIFYNQTSGKRTNYRRRTINYFNLYFKKNV